MCRLGRPIFDINETQPEEEIATFHLLKFLSSPLSKTGEENWNLFIHLFRDGLTGCSSSRQNIYRLAIGFPFCVSLLRALALLRPRGRSRPLSSDLESDFSTFPGASQVKSPSTRTAKVRLLSVDRALGVPPLIRRKGCDWGRRWQRTLERLKVLENVTGMTAYSRPTKAEYMGIG